MRPDYYSSHTRYGKSTKDDRMVVPTKPADAGDFSYMIPLAFLHEGTRFVATKGNITRTGVTDIDGHRVSANYGFRQGNHYYDDPDKDYINVKWDGYENTYHTARPNSGLYVRDGFNVYVNKAAYDQYLVDLAYNDDLAANRAKEAKSTKLEEEIAEAERRLEEAKRRLNAFNAYGFYNG